MTKRTPLWFAVVTAMAVACDDEPKEENLAPTAASLAAEKPSAPTTQAFEVVEDSSEVGFVMEAPVEKIHGEAPDSATGELFIDLEDLTKSTGLIKIDLMDLSLYQQKREDEEEAFGEKTKSETQNEHMRTWFEISEDAPPDVREKNRYVEYKLTEIKDVSAKNVNELSGAERKVTATVTGDFRLHGRKTEKSAKIEAVFKYSDGKPQSVTIKTVEPMVVGLEEHDVRPREAFGKLAQKTLSALGQKVATEAPITLEFTARAK